MLEQLCKLVTLTSESAGDLGLPITHWTQEDKRKIPGGIEQQAADQQQP